MSLRTVSLRELEVWLKRNPHVTWGPKSWGSEMQDRPGLHRGKYIDVSIDTRTMTIWRVELRGLAGSMITVSIHDDGGGSILDELERRLTEDSK